MECYFRKACWCFVMRSFSVRYRIVPNSFDKIDSKILEQKCDRAIGQQCCSAIGQQFETADESPF